MYRLFLQALQRMHGRGCRGSSVTAKGARSVDFGSKTESRDVEGRDNVREGEGVC